MKIMTLLSSACFFLMMLSGCSSSPAEKQVAEDKSPSVMGTHYTTVVFPKGQKTLSSSDKKNLTDLAAKAHESDRRIDEIRILAWPDKEYPDPKTQPSTSDIQLASERAQEIRNYLEDELKETGDIDSFNMARRPDFLSKLLKDDEFKVKEAFQESGATASKLPDGSVSYTKASKALVIIDYEGDDDNFK